MHVNGSLVCLVLGCDWLVGFRGVELVNIMVSSYEGHTYISSSISVLDFYFGIFPDLKLWRYDPHMMLCKAYHTLQIPVYSGCSMPLLATKQHAGDYHGKDGLGDVPDPNAPSLELLQKRKAVQAIVKMVKQNPGEVSFICQ